MKLKRLNENFKEDLSGKYIRIEDLEYIKEILKSYLSASEFAENESERAFFLEGGINEVLEFIKDK